MKCLYGNFSTNAAGVLVAQGVISANVNTLECVNATLTAVNTTLDAGYGLYFTLRHLAVSSITPQLQGKINIKFSQS